MSTNAIATGNNISVITDYQDNYGAGNQAKKYSSTYNQTYADNGFIKYSVRTTDAHMNRAVPYADKYGRIDYIDIQNVTDSDIVYTGSSTLETNMTTLANALPSIKALDDDRKPTGDSYVRISYDGYSETDPRPTVSRVGCRQQIYIDKDSREVIHINQQHHFLSNDNDVIVGSGMTEYCRYIQNNDVTCRLVYLNNKIDSYEFKISDDDIIPLEVVGESTELTDDENIARIATSTLLLDLTTEITSTNLQYILSTTNNTDDLYIQPGLNRAGNTVGLTEDAKAWAIITDDNYLIIGRNQDLYADDINTEDNTTNKIYMSITSKY